MVRERVALWAKVERVRREISRVGLPPEKASPFGRALDFLAYEPRNPDAFIASLNAALGADQPLDPSIREIMKTCAANHLKFNLVAMPVPKDHRQRFYASASWQTYRRHVQDLVEASQGRLIDTSDWISDAEFEDVLHLNAAGARIFSVRLAREICVRPGGAAEEQR
jgi:hypothetical protein